MAVIWWPFMRGDEALGARVPEAIGRMDLWLETMRGPRGYGGPISHWWDSSLIYTGPMLDWRYEGIVCGYLNLYRATRAQIWLDKAARAADDLLAGQWPDGRFWNSSFEFGPAAGGTPHEAAADIALLEMACALRDAGSTEWEKYLRGAEHNIQRVLIGQLWNGRGFKDQPGDDWLVANKNATALEAVWLYQSLSGASMETFIDRAGQVVLRAQVPDGPRAGATIHIGTHRHGLAIGIYTARCVCSLARLLAHQPRAEYRNFIERALRYLVGLIQRDGTWVGHYKTGAPIAAPRWISPCGELLRAFLWAREHVPVDDAWIHHLTRILLDAQQPSGGLPTAIGFANLGRSRLAMGLPEFRDVLPVAGWCDKAFRALTILAPAAHPGSIAPTEIKCAWRGRACSYLEDTVEIRLTDDVTGECLYLWQKGQTYPARMRLWH